MPQDRGRRRNSRSPSPNRKRSWQTSSFSSGDRGRLRSFSPPPHSHRKQFKSPQKFRGTRKEYPPNSPGAQGQSPSSRSLKRHRNKSPEQDTGPSSSFTRRPPQRFGERRRSGSRPHGDRGGSRLHERSPSPQPPPKGNVERLKHEGKYRKAYFSPEDQHSGPSSKKKSRHSPSPGLKRQPSPSHRSPSFSSQKRGEPSSRRQRGDSIPQRRVGVDGGKQKAQRLTLHKRFTLDDQEPFLLGDNVTIAILRNPNAEPSEDVTVKRVFDPSQFKMVHKKGAGRKPIFDREEIKVWRHDENLADDPDFERRLVRVKSAQKVPASESLSRMSPDVIRKAFGLQIGGARSRSRSSGREPKIKLDPRPDPRYESKYREQLEKEEESIRRRKSEDRRKVDDRKSLDERKGSDDRGHRMDDDRRGGRPDGGRGKGEMYDLRQALERRRSDREDGGFKIEVRRDVDSSTELFYREGDRGRMSSMERRLDSGRNVVLGSNRGRFGGSMEREGGRLWEGDKRRGWGRGRGRGGPRRREWSGERESFDIGGRDAQDQLDSRVRNFRETDRSTERRQRFSQSPVSNRGWRGGYRGRARGRGRDRDYGVYDQDMASSTQLEDAFKYSQHDDRDVSPKPFRGRGRGRFRGFGSSSFRAYRSGRGFRGGYRGRGGYKFGESRTFDGGDRRSVERVREVSEDREWKHDMYDTLQAEEEQPHSTTVGN